MLTFLADNLATIIISLVLLGLVFLAIRYQVRKRRDGGCGCGCSGCSQARACQRPK